MLLVSLFLYKVYLTSIENCDQKKCHKAHEPAEIYGMGEVDVLEKRRDLREDQPQGKSDHGNAKSQRGMGTSAQAGEKQGHKSDQSVSCC